MLHGLGSTPALGFLRIGPREGAEYAKDLSSAPRNCYRDEGFLHAIMAVFLEYSDVSTSTSNHKPLAKSIFMASYCASNDQTHSYRGATKMPNVLTPHCFLVCASVIELQEYCTSHLRVAKSGCQCTRLNLKADAESDGAAMEPILSDMMILISHLLPSGSQEARVAVQLLGKAFILLGLATSFIST